MSLAVEAVVPNFQALVPQDFARNGLVPNGQIARTLARQLNHLIGRHGVIIPGFECLPSQARNSSSELALWRTRYRAGPNGNVLVAEVHCLPTDDTAGSPRWYINVDGSKATDASLGGTPDNTHNVRAPSGGGTSLADVFVMRQRISVTANAKHTLELVTDDKCRVVGWFLREEQRETLTVGSDQLVDYTYLLALSGIYDRDWAKLVDIADQIYNKLRGQHIAWSVIDPSSPITVSSTTPASIWESSNTIGALCGTQYRETYSNNYASTLTIPTYAWCYAARTAGAGNGFVRFVGANGTTDITVNGALGEWSSTSFTLKPDAAGDTVKVYAYVEAGTTIQVYSAAMLPLIGT